MSATSLTSAVKTAAHREGFAAAGVLPAEVSIDQSAFRSWLAAGHNADMAYLARNGDKRQRPGSLVDGARSIICLAVSYSPAAPALGDACVARYARGRDYHKVLTQRCRGLIDALRRLDSGFAGRAFVDTAPIPERSLAAAAGLGWIGRNGCLIVPKLGSYVVLCEIICNLQLEPDGPCDQDKACCDNCSLCVDACPTGAIITNGVVDARLCRSYLTVEHRGPIDPALWAKMDSCLFGCDACQSVCPYNRNLPAGDDELAQPSAAGALTVAEVLTWSADDWDAATRGSTMRRATFDTFVRNAVLAAGNCGGEELIDVLTSLWTSRSDLAGETAWALDRIRGR